MYFSLNFNHAHKSLQNGGIVISVDRNVHAGYVLYRALVIIKCSIACGRIWNIFLRKSHVGQLLNNLQKKQTNYAYIEDPILCFFRQADVKIFSKFEVVVVYQQ
jgi:hypothetical protein